MQHGIYGNTLYALLQSLGPLLDKGLAREFKAIGIDLQRQLEPLYPADVWSLAVQVAARALKPEDTPEEAEYQLGRRFVYALGNTEPGKGLTWAVHVAGPRKTLEQFNELLMLANTFSATRVLERTPTDYQVWVSNVIRPYFVRGLFASMLELTGAISARVDVIQQTPEGIMLHARWYDVVQDLRIRIVRV